MRHGAEQNSGCREDLVDLDESPLAARSNDGLSLIRNNHSAPLRAYFRSLTADTSE